MKKEELLSYINHAIQVESNMLSQQNLIREYDESSEKRKPQLVEKGIPNVPEIERLPFEVKCLLWPSAVMGLVGTIAVLACGSVAGTIILGIPSGLLIWYLIKKEKDCNAKEGAFAREVFLVEEENKERKIEYRNQLVRWNYANAEAHKYFEKPLAETQAVLDKIYSADIIYPKYRNLPALTSMYEYLITGRCEELTGPHGAYNLYEDELRKDTIISQMNLVIQNLEQIKSNQYMLYEQVKKIQAASRAAVAELRAIHGYAANIADYASLTAYYAGITAVNTRVSDYCHTL